MSENSNKTDFFGEIIKNQNSLIYTPIDTPEAMAELKQAEELVVKGRACVNQADVFGAYDYLSDALYIRKKYFKEGHDLIKEILILLEQTTFM